MSFNRVREGIIRPNLKVMENIINHMRVFAIESFRYIPQFDLRDIFGSYHSDRLIFLMTLIELTNCQFNDPRMKYIVKKYAHLWNVPFAKVILNPSVAIIATRLDSIDQ